MRICRICEKSFRDYDKRTRTRCGACNTKIRRLRFKLAAIEYLGGKCQNCGYADPRALEFHHLRDKKFSIGMVANKSFLSLKEELDKCQLLCSNCHRIKHSERFDEKWKNELKTYKGTFKSFADIA